MTRAGLRPILIAHCFDRGLTRAGVRSRSGGRDHCPIEIAGTRGRPRRGMPRAGAAAHLDCALFRPGTTQRRAGDADNCLDAARATASASVGGRRRVGREADGGRAQADRGAAEPAASASRAASGPLARARDAASERRAPFASIGARVSILAAVARGVAQGGVSGHSFLGAERSRPPRRRRRRTGRSRPRAPGARGPLRQGRQPRGPTARERLVQPLSLSCAAHADGSEAWARLRPPQLPEAPAGAGGDRSAQLGALVRWVAAESPWPRRRGRRSHLAEAARRQPGRRAEDVARDRRLASRGRRGRARRTAGARSQRRGSRRPPRPRAIEDARLTTARRCRASSASRSGRSSSPSRWRSR